MNDVRLIESEVLAPPTASTFKRSISMIGSHRWKKTVRKWPTSLARLASVKVKSPNPPQWNIVVLSIVDLVQLAIRKY